jgi:hypothetical protein
MPQRWHAADETVRCIMRASAGRSHAEQRCGISSAAMQSGCRRRLARYGWVRGGAVLRGSKTFGGVRHIAREVIIPAAASSSGHNCIRRAGWDIEQPDCRVEAGVPLQARSLEADEQL